MGDSQGEKICKNRLFISWLMAQREREHIIGDLANDAEGDKKFEACGADKGALERYLLQRMWGRS